MALKHTCVTPIRKVDGSGFQWTGGWPQGAYLGGLIFIVKYNGAFLRPPVPKNIVDQPLSLSLSL